jgi:hypothetical protein
MEFEAGSSPAGLLSLFSNYTNYSNNLCTKEGITVFFVSRGIRN